MATGPRERRVNASQARDGSGNRANGALVRFRRI
jgi:hypothetical protein